MKRNRWQEITRLYHAALDLPENERATLLEACIDGDIRQEVQSLLANEKDKNSVFDDSALDVAAKDGMKEPVSLAGAQLGNYRLTAELGRGGMGEVYRARDQKLGRDVAIKVLPEEFAQDADRIARFQREARMLASLNHPHIAAIYGLEESDGTHFLVLELVEGETLADRLKRGSIPVDEALPLALKIAEALEAAHEKRIIHRDLKPANIKVSPDASVKVLDFGLAKMLSEEQQANLSNSPTISTAATQKGVILGTSAYMSPEQARGRAVDKRTDIWAFGCILYEMLTGQPLFSGEDVNDILAAVIHAEPDWRSLHGILPWRLREVIQRCLQKDLRERYHDISDVRLDMRKAIADPSEIMPQPIEKPGRWLSLRQAVVAMVLTTAVVGVIAWIVKRVPAPEAPPVVRFSYEVPEEPHIDLPGLFQAVSRDGTQFVSCAEKGLYLRYLNETDARFIPGTGDNPQSPFFSPDGKWIGYFSRTDGQLKRIAVTGGTPDVLCSATQVFGAEWSSDKTIIFGDGIHGIMRVSETGGTPERIVAGHLAMPQLLPDGKSVLFTDVSSVPTYKIMVESLESQKRKEIIAAEWARYLPSGHLVYGYVIWSSEPRTYAVSFDPEKLEETGERILLSEFATAIPPAISGSGTVVFFSRIPGPLTAKSTLVWLDRNGNEEPLALAAGFYGTQDISPDGAKIAVAVAESDENVDIYIYDFLTKNRNRLTFDKGIDTCPLWTPDGKRIVFRSNREGEGLYWKAANGSGEVERLWLASDGVLFPCDWSGDGKFLVLSEVARATDEDIGILSMDSKREWKPLLQEKHKESAPQISPDGRFMAYISNEFGKSGIYIRPFPDVKKNQWQIPADGASGLRWSRYSKELFYHSRDAFMAVPVETDPEFRFGIPKVLFRGSYGTNWSVGRDGRFLLTRPLPPSGNSTAQTLPRKIDVILNWFEELKQHAPPLRSH